MTDDEALKILVALGDPVRFEIFRKVGESPGLSSSELKSGKSASTISHHAKLLVDAGLLEANKDGKYLRYRIHRGTLASFARWAAENCEMATIDDLTKYIADNPV